MTPAVTVILNCYNHERYVAEAIKSVLGQTFQDFELILIDNGSTDGSRAVLERYDDPRIRRLFHDENQSLSKRLNEGVAAARGEFVAILYSDDWMLPDKLERQVALFRTVGPEYGVVYCPALGFNQQTGERWQYPLYAISGPMMPAMLARHWEGHIDMSSPLTRRVCLERYRWFEDLPLEGEAIFMRIALSYAFLYDAAPTVVLRDHGSNAGKRIKLNHEMAIELLDRFEKQSEFPIADKPVARQFRSAIYRRHLWALLRLDPDQATYVRKRLLKMVQSDPAQLRHPRLLGSLVLSVLPASFRRGLNRIADGLTHHPGTRAHVEHE